MAGKLPFAMVYDWDNTLIDTFPLLFEVTNLTRTTFGLEAWDEQTAKRNMRLPAREVWPGIFGADRWQEAHQFYMGHMRARHLQDMAILDGAVELIAYAGQRGIKQAVFSNKNCLLLRDEVAHFEGGRLFEAVIGNGDYEGLGKPDPAGLHFVLKVMGLESKDYSNTWYLGDTENDLKTAHAAGVIPVFIENITMSDPSEIAILRPEFSFKSCIDCLAYLKALG